jgi:hypothetical protein
MRHSRDRQGSVLLVALVLAQGAVVLAQPQALFQNPVDFASPIATDTPRYDRCKATHRCNRAWARFDRLNDSWTFTKQVFRDGLHEPASMFLDFEHWEAGTMGMEYDAGFLARHRTTGNSSFTQGPLFNTFDWPIHFSRLYLNHSSIVQVDTDAATITVTHVGPQVLSYALPTLNATGGLVPPSPFLALSLDSVSYQSSPQASGTVIQGVKALTRRGSPVTLFNFGSLYLGPPVMVNFTGSRPCVWLSRTSAVVDTPLVVYPGTLGGFPGARNLSVLSGVGANELGPGASSVRVQLWTVQASATDVNEVQQIETSVRAGQTLRGFFTLSFKGRHTHPIRATAEPDEVRSRIESALPEAGRVRVSRSLLTPQGGHIWNITYTGAVGDQPQLQASSRGLTGIGAGIVTRTLVEGNNLEGQFTLQWRGLTTSAISVTATADEVRTAMEAAWGPSLAHAHVSRSNAFARRSDVCISGRCVPPSAPGPAWDVTWLLTLSFRGGEQAGGNAQWRAPDGADKSTVYPWQPVTVSPSGVLGAGANVTIVPGHGALGGQNGAGAVTGAIAPAASSLPAHEFFDVPVFSLAFGGAGGSSGGIGGIGHARHGPVAPAPYPGPAEDLLGASGGAMGGEVPQQPLSALGPNYIALLASQGALSCADPPLPWDGVWAGALPANVSNSTSGCPGAGGAGGGAFALFAANDIVIGGSSGLIADGADAEDGWRGGGGGGGGTILLGAGGSISVRAPLSARGGNGGRGVGLGSRGGGGGGGGVIAAFAQSVVLEGPGAEPLPGGGQDGVGSGWDIASGLASISVEGGAGGLDEELLSPNATRNASIDVAEERRLLRAEALANAAWSTSALNVVSLNGTGSFEPVPAEVGSAFPGAWNTGVRPLAAASGQDGLLSLLSAGGAQYRIETAPGPGNQGGAEDTQRALLVRVGETSFASGGGVETGIERLREPFAHNGPFVRLPVNDSGVWWLRRGANTSLPAVALADAGGAASQVYNAYLDGGSVSSEQVSVLGGAGMDGTDGWGPGATPERVTVYVRLGKSAYGDGNDFWGPHIALHEFDFRNGSAGDRDALRQQRDAGAFVEGNSGASSTGGAGPGGAGAAYGTGVAEDGGEGGGIGGDASVLMGVGVVDGRWLHGANYRHSPSLEPFPGASALSVTQHVDLGVWYKVDFFISWTNHTYRLRINDVTVATEQPFNGSSIRRIGLYMFHAGEAWFDELYAGPDDTMGFECPAAGSDGALHMQRPVQSGWIREDIGHDSFDWNITRHDNHVSQRPLYTHPLRGGLVFGDGSPHRRYHRDIKTITPDGDHSASHGRLLAGALLYVPGDAPSRSLVDRAKTTAGSREGDWGAAPSDDQARLADSAGGLWGYGEIDSIDKQDGFGQVSFHGKTGRYYWYGEHDTNVPSRNVSGLIPPSQANNGGLAHPVISRGGVGACSTNDMRVWRNEGLMYRFENISLPIDDPYGPVNLTSNELYQFRSERPKVVYNNDTDQFVMWQHVDDTPARSRRAAGVALSLWPNGPFTWLHSVFPDHNETTDLTVLQDRRTGAAFLARTYYETTDYWLPEPVMQPVWESVKNENGTRDYSLNYHRAFYHEGYDNPDDIYIQRWRMEDKSWNITIGPWTETWDDARQVFILRHTNGDTKQYTPAERQIVLDDTVDRYAFRLINGQGRPPIVSRYLSPNATENNHWSPSSVPAVKTQPWRENYEDKNIADNPPHPTVPDLLIGPEHVVETRRAKFVAVSLLNTNYTETMGVLRIIEGEMEGQQDLISVVGDGGAFGWEALNVTTPSTFGFDIRGRHLPFDFRTQVDWFDRHWQFTSQWNDRYLDYRNFRDRQTSFECPSIHHASIAKKDECLFILHHVLAEEDSPAVNNSDFRMQSYSRALDTTRYETCLTQHRNLLLQYRLCVRKSVPIYERSAPVSVGSRECVGGGGQCGPPPPGLDAVLEYGFGTNAPNYTQIYGPAGFQRPRETWGPT